jgi:2-polyprenyl-6-methoxyphenol hydroxylase-like FAD-dependent oxidoreductase
VCQEIRVQIDTEVLVVGAGPVGLTLALDLGRRGIRTLVIERKAGPLRLPKMERTNPRSMEIYRRLGVADRIRARGLPPDKSMDIFLVASLARPPLARIHYPGVDEARAQISASQDGRLPREPWQLISQYTLEPILIEALRAVPNVQLMFETELETLEEGPGGVSVRARRAGAAEDVRIQARYVAGCDGAGSRVRSLIGVEMEGRANLGNLTNVFFRCDDLLAKSRVPQGRHWQFVTESANGGAGGSIVMQDDLRHFGYHTAVTPEGDPAAFLRRQTGLDIDPTVLHVGPWTQNMLVAKTHRRGRVFLAGDANHIFIPAGGLGMNTGVVDAINLGWKLAAVLRGWGGEELLESYSVERNAIARRTLGFVAYAVEGAIHMRDGFEWSMLEDTASARAALEGYLARAVPLMRRVYDMHGADLGYRYSSPVIAEEDGEPPRDDAYVYEPSTWPGAHLPHLWLEDGVAVYDRLGAGFTLLNLGGEGAETGPIEAAFRNLGAPLQVLSLPDPALRTVYRRKLILVRPDVHVAWRGDRTPEQPGALAARVLGRAA